jgi:hypothetical protein
MRSVVPDQDSGIDLGRRPAPPNSGFEMRDTGLLGTPRRDLQANATPIPSSICLGHATLAEPHLGRRWTRSG